MCCPAGTKCATSAGGIYNPQTFMCQNDSTAQNVTVSKAPCKSGPGSPPAVATSQKLKNVLVIGDSVSIGYVGWVGELLADIAIVQHAPWEYLPGQGGDGGAEDTGYGVQCLDYWLRGPGGQPFQADLVYFNWGLHNTGNGELFPGQVGLLRDYQAELSNITARLKRYASSTGAKLLFGLTTAFMCDAAADKVISGTLNPQAAVVMQQHGVATVGASPHSPVRHVLHPLPLSRAVLHWLPLSVLSLWSPNLDRACVCCWLCGAQTCTLQSLGSADPARTRTAPVCLGVAGALTAATRVMSGWRTPPLPLQFASCW